MKSAGPDAAIWIIGYGNPMRGDDGVGFLLAQQLAEAVNGPLVSTLSCHQLTPELAEPISRAAYVVFLDASCDDPPGRVTQRTLRPETSAAAANSHVLSPETLLGCSRLLYGQAPEATLFTIGGERFDYHEGLSAIVEQACCDLIPRIGQLVRAHASLLGLSAWNERQSADQAQAASLAPVRRPE